MMNKTERVNTMLQGRRKDILVFAAAFAEEHDERAYDYLVNKVPQSGFIKDSTSPNLEAKVAEPGAFFNKRMRPIPLGSK